MTTKADNSYRSDGLRIVKQGDPEERITLLVSTDAMDDEGDVVEQSWQFDDQIPFLWSHKTREVSLGHIINPRVVQANRVSVELSDEATRATLVDVDFDPDDPRAQAVKRKYERGDIEDSSVGFDPIEMERFEEDEAGRFHFRESRLKEVSAVNIGANPDTTTIRKALGDDVDDQVVESLVGEGGGKTDAPDQAKEGRRNSKMDDAVQEHIKECAEYLKGDREMGDVKECPLHKMGDDDSDKSGPETTVTVDAEQVAEIVEQKVDEALEKAQKGDDTQDTQESDDAVTIDGEKIIRLDEDESEQPGSSSGDAGDGDTSEIDVSAL